MIFQNPQKKSRSHTHSDTLTKGKAAYKNILQKHSQKKKKKEWEVLILLSSLFIKRFSFFCC